MSPFQILLLTVMLCLLLIAVTALVRGWIPPGAGVFWTLLCAAGVAAVVWPDLTTRLARAVGIGRGKDLILYCSVIVMFVGFLMTYVRLRRLQREITLLVRHLALHDSPEPPAS